LVFREVFEVLVLFAAFELLLALLESSLVDSLLVETGVLKELQKLSLIGHGRHAFHAVGMVVQLIDDVGLFDLILPLNLFQLNLTLQPGNVIGLILRQSPIIRIPYPHHKS
jgi:hypothetical protein